MYKKVIPKKTTDNESTDQKSIMAFHMKIINWYGLIFRLQISPC